MNQQDYLKRLKEIGVRTDKRIEIMYSDLFRITENAFLKECHATEAFELYDFVKEKEKFRELHELRRHIEGLLEWMYPEHFPSWIRSTNRRFRQLTNPYLDIGYDPISSKNFSMSDQVISAAFNLRRGLRGEQFKQDREILLQKLQDRHFSAAVLEQFAGKHNSQIPPIGLDLMKQEIYLMDCGETFLPGNLNEENISAGWQKKYKGIFDKFSDTGLTIYLNERIGQDNSGPARKGILAALKQQLIRREIDFSSIGAQDQLEMQQGVLLADKKLHTIKELSKDVVMGMLMILREKEKTGSCSIEITEIGKNDIFYLNKGRKCSVNINYLFRFFYKQLLEHS